MATKIRLARGGSKKRPFYRVVVADTRSPRDGRFIEKLGTHNPLLAKDNNERTVLNEERVKYWLSVGATPSDRVESLLIAAKLFKRSKKKQDVLDARTKISQEAVKKKKAEEEAKRKAQEAEAAAEKKAQEEAEKAAKAEEAAAEAGEAPAEEANNEAPAEEKNDEAPAEEASDDAPAEKAKEEAPAEESPDKEEKADVETSGGSDDGEDKNAESA